MKIIKEMVINEIVVKNSKFITIIKPFNDEFELNKIISDIKSEYKGATHYCYAYITGNLKRSSDDGEPSGTAGLPILNVLEKNDLANIICIVIRYYGGIKLGAGGLIRTYGKAVRETLKLAELTDIIECYKILISFKYDMLKEIDFIINKNTVTKKIFDEDITYEVIVNIDDLDIVEKLKLANASILEIKKTYY